MGLILYSLFILYSVSSLQTLRTPKLVPDDTEPVWSRTAQRVPLNSLKQRIQGVVSELSVYQEDPRIGPVLLLGALISLGTIWLRRNQQVQISESNQPSQPSSEVTFGLMCFFCVVFKLIYRQQMD